MSKNAVILKMSHTSFFDQYEAFVRMITDLTAIETRKEIIAS